MLVGGKSPAFFHNGARMLAGLLPNAERRALPGQTHMVKAKVLAPVLVEFAGGRAAGADRARAAGGGEGCLRATRRPRRTSGGTTTTRTAPAHDGAGRGVLRHSRRMLARRTKIVATLGPATDSPELLDALLAAGMDCARLNCSHGTPTTSAPRRGGARRRPSAPARPLGAPVRPPGPEAAPVGRRPRSAGSRPARRSPSPAATGAGEPIDSASTSPTSRRWSPSARRSSIGDGMPRFAVERVAATRCVARAVTAGPLSPRKGINVTYARPNLPALTEKDVADLALAAECGADFVALCFVRSAADVERPARPPARARQQARTIAKIEKVEAYEHLDEILEVADGVMVARGDYGVEAGVARVPLMQKDTIFRATQAGKTVITATQMLESMIHAPEPTRAEAADVANAVIDGTSAVMLSAETGVGSYPVEAVRAMAEIAEAAEESPVIHGRAAASRPDSAGGVRHARRGRARRRRSTPPRWSSRPRPAAAPRACAKYRPRRPIVALVHDAQVANQLDARVGRHPSPMDVAESVDDLVEDALVARGDVAGLPDAAPASCSPRAAAPARPARRA